MTPDAGSAVSMDIPTDFRAVVFSTQAWPDRWLSLTGRSGAARSRSHRYGCRRSESEKSSYPLPRTQPPGGVDPARSLTALWISPIDPRAFGPQSTASRLEA